MAGAYCMFCDQRCFVYRQVIVGGELMWAGHMATCKRGRAHDKKHLGVDFEAAYNPYDVADDLSASSPTVAAPREENTDD